MIWVLDTSAAIEVVLNRPLGSFIANALKESEFIVAPELYFAEAGNVFWKYQMFENLDVKICKQLFQLCIDLIDNYVSHDSIIHTAYHLAIKHEITVYDALYLSIAHTNQNIGIITLDTKLSQVSTKLGLQVFATE